MISFKLFREYHEERGGTFSDNGTNYDINKIFDLTEDLPTTKVKVKDLVWIVPDKIPKSDLSRAKDVDTEVPIIIIKRGPKLLVVDGYHRMIKAQKENLETLDAKMMTQEMLDKAKINN